MDGTRELVDAHSVGMALAVLSLIAVALTLVLGSVARSRNSVSAKRGTLLAMCGILLFPLWTVYNRIEDHFGLDSVAALLINLTLFVVVGGLVGLALRRLWPAAQEQSSPQSAQGTQS